MPAAIPAEAIERFRTIERRAIAASVTASTYFERLQPLQKLEGELLGDLQRHYNRSGEGRVEIDAGGKVTLHSPSRENVHRDPDGTTRTEVIGGKVRVLAENDHHAKELHATREAITDLKRRRDTASAEARPLNALRTACADYLKRLGWKEV